ncbi:orotate phosphoribosyltransferase [Fistulina hepatica ATCC 64428]|uniref:orotate phosphoribosyltransferase n=1 Tax=Fistulina hepatica ATCC 64428 TaxID=1128425 RepID=A0A0D7ARA7_9AGAR|nr:orotate phosphoribosyltransferase [Fistulina hepatica ATCC 64428]
MSSLQPYQTALIEASMSVGALQFGSFVLKSGRTSPYFINAGLLNTGPILATLSTAYAHTIESRFWSVGVQFDVLFGPAYKAIPFASTTAMVLHTSFNIDVGFAYDRKEVKDHGEGGKVVGVPLNGKRVVILDDVMTSGKAIREAMETVESQGGKIVGVVQLLDREEVGRDGTSSTVQEIESIIGVGRVQSILKMKDLVSWLEEQGMTKETVAMKGYRDKYGIKSN